MWSSGSTAHLRTASEIGAGSRMARESSSPGTGSVPVGPYIQTAAAFLDKIERGQRGLCANNRLHAVEVNEMAGEPVTYFEPDRDRLAVISECMQYSGDSAGAAEWPGNIISRRAV